MYDYVGRRVASFSVGFGVLGVMLVLLGSIVEVPYTTWETFNNYPHKSPVTWADESFTLQPHANKYYVLDLISENETLVYVKVEEVTNSIFFKISYGWNPNLLIIEEYVPSVTPPEKPFEYFWTPPKHSGWRFIFDNPSDITTNATVEIICYNYNVGWQEEVTYYHPPLDKSFAYAGIAIITAALVPIVIDLYKTRKEMPKKPLWQKNAEVEKMREKEEAGRLR